MARAAAILRSGGGIARPEPGIAADAAARLGRLEPGPGALADQRPLELGGGAQHLQGEDALRAGGIDRIAEAPEMRAPGAQALDHLKQVGERAGEPVDPHHDQRVPRADPLQAAGQFDAAAASA